MNELNLKNLIIYRIEKSHGNNMKKLYFYDKIKIYVIDEAIKLKIYGVIGIIY